METLILAGPFPGTVRTKYYPNCVTLEAKRHCAPCFTHGHRPCPDALKIKKVFALFKIFAAKWNCLPPVVGVASRTYLCGILVTTPVGN